jgi:hypothetical protein
MDVPKVVAFVKERIHLCILTDVEIYCSRCTAVIIMDP